MQYTRKKVYRSHDIDDLFLISYTEAGFTSENENIDKNEATSDFIDIYPTNADPDNKLKRIKYRYESDGSFSSSAYAYWLRSAYSNSNQSVVDV